MHIDQLSVWYKGAYTQNFYLYAKKLQKVNFSCLFIWLIFRWLSILAYRLNYLDIYTLWALPAMTAKFRSISGSQKKQREQSEVKMVKLNHSSNLKPSHRNKATLNRHSAECRSLVLWGTNLGSRVGSGCLQNKREIWLNYHPFIKVLL